jgi:endonuclease III
MNNSQEKFMPLKKAGLETSRKKKITLKRNNEYIDQLLGILEQYYPQAKTALLHENPFQMLVATILSAQTTDKQVNKATPALFMEFPTPGDLASADIERIEELIHSVGFYKTKAVNIRKMAEILVTLYNGEVPDSMDELTKLPGVGRKTANVVLGNSFGKAVGVVVDTHVIRLSQRLGLSDKSDPEKIEKDLMDVIPQDKWIWFSHALIYHGREICTARKPDCPGCPLNHICPSAFSF